MCGAAQMVDVLRWCLQLGVTHVSVYAFSIDNFRRSPGEVSALMALAEDKYGELCRVRARVPVAWRLPRASGRAGEGCRQQQAG